MANPIKYLSVIIIAWLAGCATGSVQQSGAPRIDLDSHVVLASIARERQNTAEAAENYLAAALLSDDPRFAELATELAHESNLTELGREAADRWQMLTPDNPRVHQFLGVFNLRSGDLVGAIAEFEQILAATDNHGPALAFIIEFLANESDPQITTAVVSQLVANYPGTPEGHYGLARLGLRSGNYQMALENAERVVGRVDRSTWQFNRGDFA